jgi:hypothetical protein
MAVTKVSMGREDCTKCGAMKIINDIQNFRVYNRVEKEVMDAMHDCSKSGGEPITEGDGTPANPYRMQCPGYQGKTR